MKRLLIALLAAAATPVSYGAVSFQNDGINTGWSPGQAPQAKGTVIDVASPAFQGSNAIQFTQTWIPNYSGRYHSEVHLQGSQLKGQDRYYGMTVYLPSNWSTKDDKVCIQQWAGDGPWLMMEVRGTNLVVLPHVAGIQTLQTMPIGQWVRIVTHLNASSKGVFEVWVNGVKRMSLTGNFTPPTASSNQVRWSAGAYITGWTGLKTQPSPGVRQLYGDHYRVASTQAEAEPANWNEP